MTAVRLIEAGFLDYREAWDLQKRLLKMNLRQEIGDVLILTQHPHTYTVGRTGDDKHLLIDERTLKTLGADVFHIDRGGDITYHGPGQIVGYPIFDLRRFYKDVQRFLRDLEEVMIRTLSEFGLVGGRIPGLTGVWVDGAKVGAIGIKVSRWITMHGFALNVNTDLDYFGHIVPCGIADKPVTSMEKLLGQKVDVHRVGEVLLQKLADVFGLVYEPQALNELADVQDLGSK